MEEIGKGKTFDHCYICVKRGEGERERERKRKWVSVSVCVRERERKRKWVSVCVCVKERERERESEWVCVWERERERVSEFVCVCVRERERERERMGIRTINNSRKRFYQVPFQGFAIKATFTLKRLFLVKIYAPSKSRLSWKCLHGQSREY